MAMARGRRGRFFISFIVATMLLLWPMAVWADTTAGGKCATGTTSVTVTQINQTPADNDDAANTRELDQTGRAPIFLFLAAGSLACGACARMLRGRCSSHRVASK